MITVRPQRAGLAVSLMILGIPFQGYGTHITSCPSYDWTIAPGTDYATHSGSISAGGERVYRLSVTNGRIYRFTFCEGGGTANYDTFLYLRDTSCAVAVQNDDACNLLSRIEWTATYSGYAYLTVAGYQQNAGSYTLAYRETIPADSVTVTAPNGGESWQGGSTQNITWTLANPVNVASFRLSYSTDGGSTYPNQIATGSSSSATSYAWTVLASTPFFGHFFSECG